MKTFIIYSKQPITSRINEANFAQIKFFKNGLRWFYFLGIFSPIFLFFRRQYKLGVLMLILFVFIAFLPVLLPDFASHIYFFSISIQVLLVIFGDDLEEFFLKMAGYQAMGVILGKNASCAQERLGCMLNVFFSTEEKANIFVRIINNFREKKLAKQF